MILLYFDLVSSSATVILRFVLYLYYKVRHMITGGAGWRAVAKQLVVTVEKPDG